MTDFLGRFEGAAQGAEQRNNFFSGLLAEALDSMGIRCNQPANSSKEIVGSSGGMDPALNPSEGPDVNADSNFSNANDPDGAKPWRASWSDLAPDVQRLPRVVPSPDLSNSWMDQFNVSAQGQAAESNLGNASSTGCFSESRAAQPAATSGPSGCWPERSSVADAPQVQPNTEDASLPIDPYDYNQGPRAPQDLPQQPPADVPQQTPLADLPQKPPGCDGAPSCDQPKEAPCDQAKEAPCDQAKAPDGDKPKPPEGDQQIKMGDRMFTVHPDGSADYGVVKGDCVWFVATDVLKFRTGKDPCDTDIVAEVNAIAEASGLTKNGRNPDLIYPGDKLIVPPAAKPDCQA